jgi:hypothetical protein
MHQKRSMKSLHTKLPALFVALFLTACANAPDEALTFEGYVSCQMTKSDIEALSSKLGGEVLSNGAEGEMMQIQWAPEEFLVYLNKGGKLVHIDRTKITYSYFGMLASNEGYYEVLNCGGSDA